MTYGNGKTEEYVYDHLDRLIEVYYNDSEEAAYTIKYNSNGNIYSITTSDYTLLYEYDSLGRLVRAWQKDSSGNDVIYIENYFDSFGRSTGSKYVIDGVSKEYTIKYSNDSNRVSNIRIPIGDTLSSIRYQYDEFERVTRRTVIVPSVSHYETYNYLGYTDTDGTVYTSSLISEISLYSRVDGVLTAETYGYTYDANGNITSISKNGNVINRYEYDSLNQLIREDNIEADYTELFVYDGSGNLYVRYKFDSCTDAPTSQISYTGGDSMVSYFCEDETWGDLLTRYGNTNITYDEIGNPLNWRNVRSFTWSGRQLDSAVLSNTLNIAYTYNSDGIRTRRVIEGTTVYDYVLDGTKILCETVTRGTTELYKYYYLYDEKGSIIGFQDESATYYYQKNLQGDIIRILNSAGTILVEYTYNAFGEVLSVTGSHASTLGQRNPFRYRGYYYDSETGFYYLNSRYYDPTVGRFLNADGIIGANGDIVGYNMFAYCSNNPVMFADPTGQFWKPLVTCFKWLKEFIATTSVYYTLDHLGFNNVTYDSARECWMTLEKYDIDTPEEKAHFFSQCYVEGNLSLTEAGYLSEKVAYEYLKDKPYYPYYGAGYIQLTWKENYQAFAAYMNDPKIVTEGPKYVAANYAWSVAGWFWETKAINEAIANGATVTNITRMINGGTSNLPERQKQYSIYIEFFGG